MKFIRITFLILLFVLPRTLWAQKVHKVSGEYIYYPPTSVSLDQARQIALDRAKIQLIANEFGTLVSSINVMHVANINGISDIQMTQLGENEVKGEWIDTIGEPKYEIGYENNMLYVKVSISGHIREHVRSSIDVNVKLLRNGQDDKFESSEFRSGDDMYLSFQSPVDGYLTVYLYDGDDTVYCLLPYQRQNAGQIPIKANTHYLFFSSENSQDIPSNIVDEYTLTSSQTIELNRLYIVFSTNLYAKAVDNSASSDSLPRMLDFNDFQKWLSKNRRQDTDMTLRQIDITIKSETNP